MSWTDTADNERGWIVYRQFAPPPPGGDFVEIARFTSTTLFGGVSFTDGDFTLPGVQWAPGYPPPMPGTCYNYAVEAYNSSGGSGLNVNGPVQMCTAGTPAAPMGLLATPLPGPRVDLSWSRSAGSVAGYRIERSPDGGLTWGALDVTAASLTLFTDATVAPATAYAYRVFAWNAAGDSPPSGTVLVVTPPPPPSPPAGLLAVASAPGPDPPVVTLTWTDTAGDETGFILERAAGSGPGLVFAAVQTLGRDTVAALDAAVAEKSVYTYRIATFNTGGNSTWSNESVVATAGRTPRAPTGLRATRVTARTARLSWSDNADNEENFQVARRRHDRRWRRVGEVTADSVGFRDTGLRSGSGYRYRVRARNGEGVSAWSNVIRIRTRLPAAAVLPSGTEAGQAGPDADGG